MNPETLARIRRLYNKEATDSRIYRELSGITSSANNKNVLLRMAADESRHEEIWGCYIQGPPKANAFLVWLFPRLARIFGLVFVINLMESGESDAVRTYTELGREVPVALEVMQDEARHEEYLISMLKEEKLSYISSMVLGLSDALVELTGALAGFTLALNDNTMIGLAGFITGVAATLSMAASEYLARKADEGEKHPLKATGYTGMAYLITVVLLLAPFALFARPLAALGCSLLNAGLIILGFTYFVSVVKRTSFLKGFHEMILISASVALISFCIGWAARAWLNLDL